MPFKRRLPSKVKDKKTNQQITEKMKRPTINDYPQTDARTFKNLDGSVDWKKYAEALEEYADSLSPSPQPSATAERCPVCGGNGLVPNGFYMQTSGQWSTTSTTPETCRTCNGSGMVIIPLLPTEAAKPVAEREVPERADVKTYLEAKSKNAGWLNFRHFLHGVGYGTEETIIAWVEQYCAGVMAEREVPSDEERKLLIDYTNWLSKDLYWLDEHEVDNYLNQIERDQ